MAKAQQGTRGGKARSRRTAPKMGRARSAGGEDRGSIALRRTTSEYRAAAEEQAARVREEIEAALVVARSTREAIEQRIADQLHAPPVSRKARTPRKRAARK
ncbi:hypothetical protein [Pyxidicoccus xibeiensis]|uniref:hypothetical protein n=1 Tax=Pyxidicoccus xibeiensis TaxID=2906759 RepID=UPI0020A8006D|nr:hypothetical protein [Pyxidicoccus xibeiensis]MCP3136839.1 hypothetical protein [Pyxidicoccus xibeiensis]